AAADLSHPAAILLGGEGRGLPGSLLQLADVRLSIPMRKPVESLNVGVAAALIAYEASRQRAGGTHESVR
ncbi:MAG: RNA methyltransferase, partial [Acidobacteria bacterium]|nr:RNA methyltransferase [Acidobacteriota bacterium]